MKKARSLVITLLLMFAFVMAVPVTGSAASKYYVTTTAVNLRSGASTRSGRVLLLPKEAAVKYLGKSGSHWYTVAYPTPPPREVTGIKWRTRTIISRSSEDRFISLI